MRELLLTGAGGFIGSYLSADLVRAGYRPRLVQRSSPHPGLVTDGRAIVGDLASMPNLPEVLEGVDTVIHAAARAHVMNERADDPEAEFNRVNAELTHRLALCAVTAGVKHFIHLSSVKVLGESTGGEPYTEVSIPSPVDAYGRSKLRAEIALQELAGRSALKLTILRPPLVYGPGVRGNIDRLLGLIRRGTPLPFASVRNSRTMVGIGNLSACILRIVEKPPSSVRICHAADPSDLSTPELIQYLAQVAGRPARLWPLPPSWLRGLAKITGTAAQIGRLTEDLVIDSRRTREALQWQPPFTVREEFERMARGLESGVRKT